MKEPTSEIWPPPPTRPEPEPDCVPAYARKCFTGINWLDAVLGVPVGFLIGFLLYAAAGLLVQAVKGAPFHHAEMEAICVLGAGLTAAVFVSRKYSLFGVTLWIGAVPFYGLMFLLEWLFSAN